MLKPQSKVPVKYKKEHVSIRPYIKHYNKTPNNTRLYHYRNCCEKILDHLEVTHKIWCQFSDKKAVTATTAFCEKIYNWVVKYNFLTKSSNGGYCFLSVKFIKYCGLLRFFNKLSQIPQTPGT